MNRNHLTANGKLAMVLIGFAAVLLAGCSDAKVKQGERDLQRPINCATAEGDIRMLQHEKTHVEEQILAGVKSISPAGAVVGVATGAEGENLQVTTGDYNQKIDQRIAEIRSECGID